MMFKFPYLGIPYYNRYSRYGYSYPYYGYSNAQRNNVQMPNINSKTHNLDTGNNNSEEKEKQADTPIFSLFGIDLYFDDILLICLIWFLYNEGVKDEELFIALILLLLS